MSKFAIIHGSKDLMAGKGIYTTNHAEVLANYLQTNDKSSTVRIDFCSSPQDAISRKSGMPTTGEPRAIVEIDDNNKITRVSNDALNWVELQQPCAVKSLEQPDVSPPVRLSPPPDSRTTKFHLVQIGSMDLSFDITRDTAKKFNDLKASVSTYLESAQGVFNDIAKKLDSIIDSNTSSMLKGLDKFAETLKTHWDTLKKDDSPAGINFIAAVTNTLRDFLSEEKDITQDNNSGPNAP